MSGANLPPSLGNAPTSAAIDDEGEGFLARAARLFTGLAERFVPDAFVFALLATVIVFVAAIATGRASFFDVVRDWGDGFWDLVPFTLQMAMVIVTGYVLATAKPVYRAIAWLASRPRTGRGAVAMVAAFAMASSWLNWGFSLIFSAMLAKETARRVARADYRTLAASAFMGLGSVWAQGLSGSAALQMATPSAMPAAVRTIVDANGAIPGGVIPLSRTIFLWQSFTSVAIELLVVPALLAFAAPTDARAKSAADLGIDLGPSPLTVDDEPPPRTPPERLERSPLLTVVVVAIGTVYLARWFHDAKDPLAAITLNVVNLTFLLVGFALHRTPAALMRAFREAVPGVWGVLLQFPFYAGIASIITKTHLSTSIARFFVGISTKATFPAVIAIYSAVLGVFVPSGGSKWVIEAPYVMQAAHDLHVSLGWMVAVYDLGEAIANLVQPFWMLPVLAIFGLRARDVMGTTFLVFLVLSPIVLVLVTVLGATVPYPM